jgi:hypothetical protein
VTSLEASLAAGIAALFTLVAVRFIIQSLAWVPRQQRWDRSARGLCSHCGYDLTGNASGICPECGTAVDPQIASNPPAGLSLILQTQPWWVWTTVAAAMLLVPLLRRVL